MKNRIAEGIKQIINGVSERAGSLKEKKRQGTFKNAVNRAIDKFREEQVIAVLNGIYVESDYMNKIGSRTVAKLNAHGIYTALDLSEALNLNIAPWKLSIRPSQLKKSFNNLLENIEDMAGHPPRLVSGEIIDWIGPEKISQLKTWGNNHINGAKNMPNNKEFMNCLIEYIKKETKNKIPQIGSAELEFDIPSDIKGLKMRIKYADGVIGQCIITSR